MHGVPAALLLTGAIAFLGAVLWEMADIRSLADLRSKSSALHARGTSILRWTKDWRLQSPLARRKQHVALSGPSDGKNFVRIEDAARRCFEETDLYSDEPISGAQRLRYHVISLIIEAHDNPSRLGIWGVQLPSTGKFKRVPVNLLDWRNMHPEGTSIKHHRYDGTEEVDWTNISVLQSEVSDYIQRVKTKFAAGERPSPNEIDDRHLTQDQRDALIDELRQRGFGDATRDYPLDVLWASDSEKGFAHSLASTLGLAGWIGEARTTLDQRKEPEFLGLYICVENMDSKPPTAGILATALREAKIDFRWLPWPGLNGRTALFVYPRKR